MPSVRGKPALTAIFMLKNKQHTILSHGLEQPDANFASKDAKNEKEYM